MMIEVTQNDIKSRHPHPCMPQDEMGRPEFKKLTLDNLKALREKAKRAMVYCREKNLELDYDEALRQHYVYNREIEKRLKYINKPVNESMKNKEYIKKLIRVVLLEHVNDQELFHLFKTIDPKSSLYADCTPFGDNLRNFAYIIMTKYKKTPEDCVHVINKYWRQSPDQAKRMVAEVVKYIQEHPTNE